MQRPVAAVIPVDLLVSAYSSGWFPMAVEPGEIRWYSPDPRGIIPLDGLPCVRDACRGSSGRGASRSTSTRISPASSAPAPPGRTRRAAGSTRRSWRRYCALHERGLAHSIETWQDGELVGGLYGVSLGGAFFGESMFHRVTDASKVALVTLVDRLRERGYVLLDTQWVTEHLAQFGAVEIPRRRYLRLLEAALKVEPRPISADPSADDVRIARPPACSSASP